jgi:hypothetical protein
MTESLTLTRYEWRLLWTLLDIWLRTDRQIEFCEADTKVLTELNDRLSRYLFAIAAAFAIGVVGIADICRTIYQIRRRRRG